MKRLQKLLLLLAVLSAGCREAGRDEHGDEAAEERHAEESAGDSESEGRTLRIDPEMRRDLRLTTAAAEARPSGDGVTALGELRVDENAYAEVGTPVPARVVGIHVAPGDTVQPGQALIELWSGDLGKARAEYLRARARSALAAQARDRKRRLAAERIAPRRELEEAEAEMRAAEADLEAGLAALRALGASAGDTGGEDAGPRFVLRAPIAGSIIERDVVRGGMADPAKALVRIADLSRLWLVAHLFERDAVRVRVGVAARASFAALPGRGFTGSVAWVGQQVEAASRTIPVRLEVANPDGALRPGMSATAWVPLGDPGEAVIAVPVASMQRLREGWCVFIPRGEGLFEIRGVGRGRELGGEIEVVSGLAAGETVVVDGAFLLKAEAERAAGAGEHHDH